MRVPTANTSGSFPWSQLALAGVVLFTLTLVDSRIRFAFSHTPNILFWDQWDIYLPLFHREGWWSVFVHQHGPHRQGLGGLANALLAEWTHWDARGDAVLTVVATAAAALVALPLARRCGARSGLWLLPVPLLFLTTRQFEAWVGPANPAHGAFPVLLTMLYGLSWFVPSVRWRLVAQVGLTFFLTFTGFALFVGALSPLLLAIEAWHLRRDRSRLVWVGLALLATVAIWALFLHGYKNQPAVPDFHFPHERPWEYGAFAFLMFSSFVRLHGHGLGPLVCGGALFLACGVIAGAYGWRVLRASPERNATGTVLFVFTASALVYCVMTAIGRVSLGWHEAPYAPRYTTLLIPAFFALFLQLERLHSGILHLAAWLCFFSAAAVSGLTLSAADRNAAEWYQRGRELWLTTFLATGNQAKADAATSSRNGFTIYPGDLQHRLEHLRRYRLGPFHEKPFP